MKRHRSGPLRVFLGILVAVTIVLLVAGLFNLIIMPLVVRKGWETEVPRLVGLTRQDAEQELTRAGLRLGNIRIVPSASGPANHVVSQNPKPGRRVKRSRPVDIDVAGDNSRVVVPEVIGLPVPQAVLALEQAGLVVARVESLRTPGVAAGQVIRVVPAPGTGAGRGTEVVIAVSTRIGAFPMPNLVGMDRETAQGIVASQGLVLGSVKTALSSERVGSVLFQYPEEGMPV
ncbi:MAG: PASTA domain-containing protein, partial [candidate division WOR-3 bacterium]